MSAHDEPMAYPGGKPPINPNPNPDVNFLLPTEVEEPFLRSLTKNIKELINPPKLPPLEVTSKPVPVKEIWGSYGGGEKRAGLTSLLIHGTVILLLLFVGTNQTVQKMVKEQVSLLAPDIDAYKPMPVKKNNMGGGGGG